jgi:hypothetical protein
VGKAVSLTIHPSGGDDEPLSAADFVKQVDSLRQLLALSDPSGFEARIVRLEMNSPATVVLEASDEGDIGKFLHGLDEVASGGEAPSQFGRPIFETLRVFASAVGAGVRSAVIASDGKMVVVDVEARRRIESVFGQDTTSEGTADGMLEAINIHGKTNAFNLYPIVGASRISCRFTEDMLQSIKPALGRYVAVQGELKYRWRERHPYEAVVNKIEILPSWEEQPSFIDILGMAPDATGGLPSEDFVSNVRSAWH